MPSSIPSPNRSPPARIHLKSTVESVPISPHAFYLEKRDEKEKRPPSLGLWASVRAKAAVFNVFDRGKPTESGPPPGSPIKPPSRIPPNPPFQGALDADYDDDDSDEGGKLKNEYDRTLRRSIDVDQRRRHSARITITNEQGQVNNYPYRSRGLTLVENPSKPSLPFAGRAGASLIDQSTTALSAVGSHSDARQALLDFPDLGNAVERYIRDGTPSVTSLDSEKATPVKPVTDGIIYNIPYDENEVYDEDFDFLGHISPGADATPKLRAREKSVRFASHGTDIGAKMVADHAVELHKHLMNSTSFGLISEDGSTLADADVEKDNRPRSLLPRPSFTATVVSQKMAPRTLSPMKTTRQQKGSTFLEKASPSPTRNMSPSSKRKRILFPLDQPLNRKESMKFRGRSQSALCTPCPQVSPQRRSLAQQRPALPFKSCLSYESLARTGCVRLPDLKAIPGETRPCAHATPAAFITESSRLNTPTLPIKLSPIPPRASTSPAKPTPARSRSPASSSKFCCSPMTPCTTQTSSLNRVKEAHAHAAAQKAAEVAELKRKNLDMLAQKQFEDEKRMKIKKSEVALKRQASHSALRSPALANLAMRRQASQSALRSPALDDSALQALQSSEKNTPRLSTSRLPALGKKKSKLPVVVKKESTTAMRRPRLTLLGGIVENPISSMTPSVMMTRAATTFFTGTGTGTGLTTRDSEQSLRRKPSQIGMTASAKGASHLKPKDSKSSLRERPSQFGLGQKARSAIPTPKLVVKSNLGHEIEGPK